MFAFGLVLAILGLFFVLIEFFLPGGIFAVFGCATLVGSIALFAMELTSWWLLIYVVLLALLVGIACQIALYWIKKSGNKGSFYLETDQEGFQVTPYDASLTHKKGVVLTNLKPSGHVLIDGEQFQAVSSMVYLTQGTEIIVVRVEGTRLIVDKI